MEGTLDINERLSQALDDYIRTGDEYHLHSVATDIYFDEENGYEDYESLLLMKMSEQRTPFYSRVLGVRYEDGHGVKKNNDKAFAMYHQAISDGNLSTYINLCELYFHTQDYIKCIEAGKEAYTKKSEISADIMSGILGFMAQSYYHKPDPDAWTAVQLFKEGIELDPEEAFNYMRLAMLYEDKTTPVYNLEEAEKAFRSAAELGDKHATVKLALIRMNQYNDYAGAKALMDGFEPEYYDAEETHLLRGAILYHDYLSGSRDSGLLDKAIAEYEAAWFHSGKENAEAANGLGVLYSAKGDQKRACRAFNNAVALKDYSHVWEAASLLYTINGVKDPLAKENIRCDFELAKLCGGKPQWRDMFYYVRFLEDCGKYMEAHIEALSAIVDYRFDNIEFYFYAVFMIYKAKDTANKDVRENMEKMLLRCVQTQNEYSARAHFLLGEFYYMDEKYLDAVEEWETCWKAGENVSYDAALKLRDIYRTGRGLVNANADRATYWDQMARQKTDVENGGATEEKAPPRSKHRAAFCVHCGEKLLEGASFCIKCGKLVNAAAAPQNETASQGANAHSAHAGGNANPLHTKNSETRSSTAGEKVRVHCNTCRKVYEISHGLGCPVCKQMFPRPAATLEIRVTTSAGAGGSGTAAAGLGIYIDEIRYGFTAKDQMPCIQVPCGDHKMYLTSGESKRTKEFIIHAPENKKYVFSVSVPPDFLT